GLSVEFPGYLAVPLPVGQVGHDLMLGEAPYEVPQLCPIVGHSNSSGMSTRRERSHSPSALACGSNRVDAATPSPRSPTMTKLRARRLGNAARCTGSGAHSGRSRFNSATVRKLRSHSYAASERAQTPRFASPPLSPDRAPTTRPSGCRCTGRGSGCCASWETVDSPLGTSIVDRG